MVDSQVGLAEALLDLRQHEAALRQVEPLLETVAAQDRAGIAEINRIKLIIIKVLQANQDLRATEMLNSTYAQLQNQLSALTEPAEQEQFLNIRWHQEIQTLHNESKNK